jgi:hypothetical protein
MPTYSFEAPAVRQQEGLIADTAKLATDTWPGTGAHGGHDGQRLRAGGEDPAQTNIFGGKVFNSMTSGRASSPGRLRLPEQS